MNHNPLFSIIIPIYNAETTLSKCVSSVFKQTCQNYELILINDGSLDGSLFQINEIIKKNVDKRILFFDQENRGAGQARNIGLSYAKGEFIVFLDSDDYLDTTFLEETKKIIQIENPEYIFIDLIREKPDGTVIRYERMSSFQYLSKDRILRWQITGKIPWGGVRKIVKRSILLNNDIKYATSIKVGEESIYSYKALFFSQKIAFQSHALYHYVHNDSSLTAHDTVQNSINVYEYVRKNLEDNTIALYYKNTVKALALTTMVIVINVLANEKTILIACKEAKKLISKYKNDFKGKIDFDALETRVKIFVPWIKIGFVLPIVLAGKLRKFMRNK